jgi:hypothetical protein
VVELKDTFWTCPLAEDSKDILLAGNIIGRQFFYKVSLVLPKFWNEY